MPKKKLPLKPEERTGPYWKELNRVIDPEIGLGIVDIGLIYDVNVKEGHAEIIMTLTSPTCPFGTSLINQAEDKMRALPEVNSVHTILTWDPPWNQSMIDKDLREMIFGF